MDAVNSERKSHIRRGAATALLKSKLERAKAVMHELDTSDCILALIGFLLSFSSPFGIPPMFSAAFCAALTLKNKSVFGVLTGQAFAAFIAIVLLRRLYIWNLIISAILVIMDKYLSEAKGRQRYAFLASSAIPYLIFTFVFMPPADIVPALLSVLIAAAITPVFIRALSVWESEEKLSIDGRLSLAFLCGAVVLGGAGLKIVGINIGIVMSIYLILTVSYSGGSAYGMTMGLVCGMMLTLWGHSPIYCIYMTICGLFSGIRLPNTLQRLASIGLMLLGTGIGMVVMHLYRYAALSLGSIIVASLAFLITNEQQLLKLRVRLIAVTASCGAIYLMRGKQVSLDTAEMSSSIAALSRDFPQNEEKLDVREMAQSHFDAIASAMLALARRSKSESVPDPYAELLVQNCIEQLDVPFTLEEISRIDKKLHIIIKYVCASASAQEHSCELMNNLSMLGVNLTLIENKSRRLYFEENPPYSVKYATASCPKDGESCCGDSADTIICGGGYAAHVLSDGMGHGESAKQSSMQAVSMVHDCLKIGYGDKQTVNAVNITMNCFLKAECYATLDLAYVNLWTGEGRLMKFGASSSYLISGDKIRGFENKNLPLGILEHIAEGEASFTVSGGDTLVFMTDGVKDLYTGEREIVTALRRISLMSSSEQELADNLLSESLSLCDYCAPDDMTVHVISFNKRNPRRG